MRATKVKADRNFRKFFTDSSRAYDLEFMAMTAALAEKCSTAPESLTDTYKEYFAKDSAALDAIEGGTTSRRSSMRRRQMSGGLARTTDNSGGCGECWLRQ